MEVRKITNVFAKTARKLKHAEKKIFVWWIRLARAHRESNKLPLFLFILLFFDAFVMVIPSILLTAAAVTITPRRWKLFAFTFVMATLTNNLTTYGIGRYFPKAEIFELLNTIGASGLWQSAEQAILDYGKFATLIGGLFGLPTQIITLIIGVADSQALETARADHPAIWLALLFCGLGHGIKMFVVTGLVRYGWVKLERRFDRGQVV